MGFKNTFYTWGFQIIKFSLALIVADNMETIVGGIGNSYCIRFGFAVAVVGINDNGNGCRW